MSRGAVLLSLMLAGSLGANGLLLAVWRRGNAAGGGEPQVIAAAAAPARATAAAPEGDRPPRAPFTLGECQERVQALAEELAALVDLRRRHLSPAQRFGELSPNAQLTASVLTELEKAIAPAGGLPCQVECREDLCRMAFADAPRPPPWFERFTDSPWARESLESVEVLEDAVFFRWREPGVVRGDDFLQEVLTNFQRSGAVEACRTRFRGAGALELRLSLLSQPAAEDADAPPGLTARTGGVLAGTPLGDCMAAELQRSLASVPLPPRFDPAILLAQLPASPPGE
jgi:hypothetical protein